MACPGSLPVGVCPSACSSTTSRTSPSTRRTMFPTTTSLGWAEVKRLPTCLMRSTSFAASRPLNSPTTRKSSAVVAMAHGLEFRICLRLSNLPCVNDHRASRVGEGYYDIRCSTEGSTGVVFSDLRNVDSPGAWIVEPWAIVGVFEYASLREALITRRTCKWNVGWWGRSFVFVYVYAKYLRPETDDRSSESTRVLATSK